MQEKQYEIVLVDGAIRMYGGEYDEVIDVKNCRYLIDSRMSRKSLVSRAFAAGQIVSRQKARVIPVFRVND